MLGKHPLVLYNLARRTNLRCFLYIKKKLNYTLENSANKFVINCSMFKVTVQGTISLLFSIVSHYRHLSTDRKMKKTNSVLLSQKSRIPSQQNYY